MQILYSGLFTQNTRFTPVSVEDGGFVRITPCGEAVSGIAFFDTNISDLTIQASDDNFSTIDFSQDVTNINGNKLVSLESPVTAAKWRVRANDTGVIGTFYPGTLITITNPSYPFRFGVDRMTDDRETVGGVRYSRFYHAARQGKWRFDYVPRSALATWESWYDTTQGFRLGFAATDPIDSTPYLVKAGGSFPLQDVFFDGMSGAIDVKEML